MSWNTFLIIILIITIPFYFWIIGFINASFFIPSIKNNEVKDFLTVHGLELVNCKEINNDGLFKLDENFITRIYSYKTYYQVYGKSIADGTEKKIRLILKKTYIPFRYDRVLHFFEL